MGTTSSKSSLQSGTWSGQLGTAGATQPQKQDSSGAPGKATRTKEDSWCRHAAYVVDAGSNHTVVFKYATSPQRQPVQLGSATLKFTALGAENHKPCNLKLADVIEGEDYAQFYGLLLSELGRLGWVGQPVLIGATAGVRKLRDSASSGPDKIERFGRDVRESGAIGPHAEFRLLEGVDEARYEWAAARALFGEFFRQSGKGEVQLFAGGGASVQVAMADSAGPPLSVPSMATRPIQEALKEKGRDAIEAEKGKLRSALEAHPIRPRGHFVCIAGFADVAEKLGFANEWVHAMATIPRLESLLEDLLAQRGAGWEAAREKWRERVEHLWPIAAAGCVRLGVLLESFPEDSQLFFAEAPPAAAAAESPPKLCWPLGHYLEDHGLAAAEAHNHES